MFLEILFFSLLGIFLGIVTGLIPGLHPNTVFILVLSLVFISPGIPLYLLVFIITLAVSNTFTDFLPSIFFGAPDPSTALSVLPAHRFLMKGEGYDALFLTVVGGIGVMVLTLLTLPILLYLIPLIYSFIYPHLHIILLLIVLWMVLTEPGISKLYAVFVFTLTGLFGLITLNSLPSETILFPAFTGLFGFSALITTILTRTVIPQQKEPGEVRGGYVKGTLTGWLAGMLVGILPGIGAAQAGVVASQTLRANNKDFLIALGGINTANIIFTFIVFYIMGKIRSGAMWALSQVSDFLTLNEMLILMSTSLIACFISAIITIRLGRIILNRIRSVKYTSLSLSVIVMLVILVFLFTGPLGLLMSLTGTSLGLMAILSGVRRTHLMGFLILPTILYFSGLSPYIGFFLGL